LSTTSKKERKAERGGKRMKRGRTGTARRDRERERRGVMGETVVRG